MTTADCLFDTNVIERPSSRREDGRDGVFSYLLARGSLEIVDYPKAPRAGLIPSVIPKLPRAKAPPSPVKGNQAQIEETLPPLHAFKPATQTLEAFVREYNGKGLDWLSLWLMRGLMDTQAASDLMSEAVEGGLIATFQHIRRPGQDKIILRQVDEIVLKGAIKRRLPRIALEHKEKLASSLLAQVKQSLSYGRRLLVDRASVSLDEGCLVAEVSRPQQDRAMGEVGPRAQLVA
jgi:hypothetical protein